MFKNHMMHALKRSALIVLNKKREKNFKGGFPSSRMEKRMPIRVHLVFDTAFDCPGNPLQRDIIVDKRIEHYAN